MTFDNVMHKISVTLCITCIVWAVARFLLTLDVLMLVFWLVMALMLRMVDDWLRPKRERGTE